MQQNTPERNYYQEDEIDLKELFKTLWLKKNFILGITATITILAGVYAFNKISAPKYGASALIKLGEYNHNNQSILGSHAKNPSSYLARELNTIYLKTLDLDYFNTGTILSIKNKGERFIEITSQSSTLEGSRVKISELVTFIQEKENQILDYRNLIKAKENKTLLKENKTLLKEKKTLLKLLKEINHNINSVKKTNPTLASIMLLEKLRLIKDIKSKTTTTVKSDISPYKNSKIFGRIDVSKLFTYSHGIKIVAVAFIAGIILSSFLVFIMNAFRSEDDKATD